MLPDNPQATNVGATAYLVWWVELRIVGEESTADIYAKLLFYLPPEYLCSAKHGPNMVWLNIFLPGAQDPYQQSLAHPSQRPYAYWLLVGSPVKHCVSHSSIPYQQAANQSQTVCVAVSPRLHLMFHRLSNPYTL